MNRVTTVGELRAVLAGLPDNAVLRPAINRFVVQPGLYVIRYAEGTCNAAYAEVLIEGHVGASETSNVALPQGVETINIGDQVCAQYERTLDDAGVTKRNVPQLCRYGQPSPDFANQPCDCPPDACRLGRNAGVEVSAQPKGK